ncbi:MAG: hypothetical protein QXK37_02690 [Candidatus Woesearchaeota archaeon]
MGIGRMIFVLGTAALIGAGGYYAFSNNSAKTRKYEAARTSNIYDNLSQLKQNNPQDYGLTKSYVIDDLITDPYLNREELRRITDVEIQHDTGYVLRKLVEFYGKDIFGIKLRGD